METVRQEQGVTAEDDAAILARTSATTQASEAAESLQQLSLGTQTSSEPLRTNKRRSDTQEPLIHSSSTSEQGSNTRVAKVSRSEIDQSGRLHSNEDGTPSVFFSTFSDTTDDSSSSMSEDTEPSSEDSSSFEGAHARYQPNAWAQLGQTLQVGVRPMIPYGPLQTATFVGAASEGAGPSGATPLRALSPPPMFNKSTERTIAATEALAWQTPVPQPSRRPGDSLVDRAEAADVSQATKTGSTHAILVDESSPGEVPQGGALQASKISRRFTKDQSLERLLGLHARRETLHQRAEAPRRVHIPLDLVEFVEERCCFMLMADGEDVNRDATDETDEFEGMVHLFEWESFTRTLLNVHSCIRWFSLSISAVSKPPTRFYLGFDLRDGTALLTVEVAAYADPWMDLMLPYLRYLRQILNSQQVEIDLGDMSPRNHDGTIFDEILLDGPAEFCDSRLAQILEAAIEMPRLKTFCVDLLNTGAGPLHEIDIRLWLTQNTSGVPRNRQYEVDAIYKDLLDCESTNTSTVGRAMDLHSAALPKLFARRELTGSSCDIAPYIVTVEHRSLPHHRVLEVIGKVCMRSSDDSD